MADAASAVRRVDCPADSRWGEATGQPRLSGHSTGWGAATAAGGVREVELIWAGGWPSPAMPARSVGHIDRR